MGNDEISVQNENVLENIGWGNTVAEFESMKGTQSTITY